MTLTEQWKNGEIEGEYYIETTNGEIYNVEFQNSISVKKKKLLKVKSFKGYVHKKTVKEVLAPVPSYEEWQAKNEENKNLYKMLDVLNGHLDSLLKEDKENQQLKKLLKECREKLKYCVRETYELQTKIDEVLK